MLEILTALIIGLAAGGAAGWFGYRYAESRKPPPPPPPTVAEVAEARKRASELEASLASATAEIQELRTLSGIPRPGDEALPLIEGSLTWRRRQLETRVRFLEAKLTEIETSSAQLLAAEARAGEAQRLRWRNLYLQGRVRYLEEEFARLATMPGADAPAVESVRLPEGVQPALLQAPRNGKSDDLKHISGIGPKLEQKLNSLGIWHYDQIASWSQDNADWVNAAIAFRGRIEREKWVTQARQLLQPAVERVPEEQGS